MRRKNNIKHIIITTTFDNKEKSVYERIKDFIDKIKLQDKNVLIVTHGGVSRAIYWYFNGIPENGNSSNINENCKIYEYESL